MAFVIVLGFLHIFIFLFNISLNKLFSRVMCMIFIGNREYKMNIVKFYPVV